MEETEIEAVEATVAQLRPGMKSVNIRFLLVEMGSPREVTSRRDGSTHRVADATVGDPTGTVLLSLWDDAIDSVEVGKTYRLENGYTSLFQGHLRLNVGRYGRLEEAEEPIEEVDRENDLSATLHEDTRRRPSYGGYGGGGWRRSWSGRRTGRQTGRRRRR